mmetsp:Transcript_15154/g.33303  ORF Transcript_15154/g.33303 Transcript_15154/m.33303 type:complete len:205 (-) Transcript_15154:1503-2117(-)
MLVLAALETGERYQLVLGRNDLRLVLSGILLDVLLEQGGIADLPNALEVGEPIWSRVLLLEVIVRHCIDHGLVEVELRRGVLGILGPEAIPELLHRHIVVIQVEHVCNAGDPRIAGFDVVDVPCCDEVLQKNPIWLSPCHQNPHRIPQSVALIACHGDGHAHAELVPLLPRHVALGAHLELIEEEMASGVHGLGANHHEHEVEV